MYSPDTPPRYLKLMEDALQSRVNGAQEALRVAKLKFRQACTVREPDPELQREREIITARAKTRAMEHLLTTVMEFNAFILDRDVPKDAPLYGSTDARSMPTCTLCGTQTDPGFGSAVLCLKCNNGPQVAS